MARQEIPEVDISTGLMAAKTQLLTNAQEINPKRYVTEHPLMLLGGTFFAGLLVGGSIRVQSQLAQFTVASLKREVLRQLLDQKMPFDFLELRSNRHR
jgi:hypothetical protein